MTVYSRMDAFFRDLWGARLKNSTKIAIRSQVKIERLFGFIDGKTLFFL